MPLKTTRCNCCTADAKVVNVQKGGIHKRRIDKAVCDVCGHVEVIENMRDLNVRKGSV